MPKQKKHKKLMMLKSQLLKKLKRRERRKKPLKQRLQPHLPQKRMQLKKLSSKKLQMQPMKISKLLKMLNLLPMLKLRWLLSSQSKIELLLMNKLNRRILLKPMNKKPRTHTTKLNSTLNKPRRDTILTSEKKRLPTPLRHGKTNKWL
jgi:hypothetical protein